MPQESCSPTDNCEQSERRHACCRTVESQMQQTQHSSQEWSFLLISHPQGSCNKIVQKGEEASGRISPSGKLKLLWVARCIHSSGASCISFPLEHGNLTLAIPHGSILKEDMFLKCNSCDHYFLTDRHSHSFVFLLNSVCSICCFRYLTASLDTLLFPL